MKHSKTLFYLGNIMVGLIMAITGCNTVSQITPTSTVQMDVSSPAKTKRPVTNDPLQTLRSDLSMPKGFAVQRYCEKGNPCLVENETITNGSQLVLLSLTGEELKVIDIPSYGEVVHIANRIDTENPNEITLIFRNDELKEYQVIIDGVVTRTFDSTNIYTLLGADSELVFALSYVPGVTGRGGTDSGLSEILISPGVGPMVISPKPENLVVPVVIRGNGEEAPHEGYLDMWYTYKPYGIGGQIIFPQHRGLYYLFGNETDFRELLPDSLQFNALSRDGSLVAFTQVPYGEMIVRNLRVNSEIAYPLLPTSHQGAGFAVFSHDSRKIAWMEASSSTSAGHYSSTIRMASVAGNSLTNVPTSVFQDVSGRPNTQVIPVGWLDNERVIIQMNPHEKSQDSSYVLILYPDGTAIESIIQGNFVELIY